MGQHLRGDECGSLDEAMALCLRSVSEYSEAKDMESEHCSKGTYGISFRPFLS